MLYSIYWSSFPISSRKFPRKSQEILGKKISQEIPMKFQGNSCGEIRKPDHPSIRGPPNLNGFPQI